jgi:hypothetical protein
MWLYNLRHLIGFAILLPVLFGWHYILKHTASAYGPLVTLIIAASALLLLFGILRRTGNAA